MLRVIGVDPDLHHTGWALVEPGRVVSCGVIRIAGRFRGAEAAVQMCRVLGVELRPRREEASSAVVEGQQVYSRSQSRADPKNLLHLATVSGAVIATLRTPTYLPTPRQWKGSVPKAIHQGRVLSELEGPWEFTRPANRRNGVIVTKYPLGIWQGSKAPTATDWKHVVDAIGLAVWGLNQ